MKFKAEIFSKYEEVDMSKFKSQPSGDAGGRVACGVIQSTKS